MKGLFGRAHLDFDRYLDVETLKSLDDEIISGIVRSKKDVGYYGNGLIRREYEAKLKDFSEVIKQFPRIFREHPKLPSRFSEPEQLCEYLAIKTKAITFGQTISLREAISGNYDGISYAKQSRTSSNAQYFPGLLKFIESLPMKEIGRVSIFLSPSGATGRVHTDGIPSQRKRLNHEFIWLSTNLDKRFYIYNSAEKKKEYVKSHSAYFNSMDPHGSDPMPFQTYSIRVDGFFTEAFSKTLKRDFHKKNTAASCVARPDISQFRGESADSQTGLALERPLSEASSKQIVAMKRSRKRQARNAQTREAAIAKEI